MDPRKARDDVPWATEENRAPPPPDDLERLSKHLGTPETWRFRIPMDIREFGVLDHTGGDGRWHDATILIDATSLGEPGQERAPGSFVAIAKHWYPDGIWRYPSGTVRPSEHIVDTAVREAEEETGLEVRLTRYLMQTDGVFYLGDPRAPERTHPWRSHVFLAEPVTDTIEPVDVREIREARIVDADDMMRHIHPRMLAVGVGGFRYRVGIQERALATVGIDVDAVRVPGDGMHREDGAG